MKTECVCCSEEFENVRGYDICGNCWEEIQSMETLEDRFNFLNS